MCGKLPAEVSMMNNAETGDDKDPIAPVDHPSGDAAADRAETPAGSESTRKPPIESAQEQRTQRKICKVESDGRADIYPLF